MFNPSRQLIKNFAVVPALIFLAFPLRTIAVDPGACFMVNSSGRTISLGKLCGVTPVDSGVIRVPIKRRIGRTPVVNVTFNGSQTFEMIFDTGASNTLITMRMANALKLKAMGTVEAHIADGSKVQFLTSEVESIAVGRAVANNLQVAIAPKASVGLLGHDFFSNYDVKIMEKELELRQR
ncbi:retropepsin-like aspartic protease [Chlorogloeopsis sp. ULAP02]|uniref:retropepsin-like aspartic protease family protein n=1 Tax=Chlorogloeopsis sp. ULAP02 TaxID=3107926 RepID=UPI00313565CE